MGVADRALLVSYAVLAALCTAGSCGRLPGARPVGLGLGLRDRYVGGRGDFRGRDYETYYIDQKIDHLGFGTDQTFKMRYLMTQQYWDKSSGPIFIYTGNEGDITWFCENTGFMWDIAPEFKAMLIFAEHRYYGKSLPFGKESYLSKESLAFLTSEQAMADFAILIKHIKASVAGAASSPVVAFGGSYGGMLAAWMRMKYPNVVAGSIAASAPIWQFPNLTDCNAAASIITNDFTEVNPVCTKTIRASWAIIDKLGKTYSGMGLLQKSLRLCKDVQTLADVEEIKDWLSGTWFNLAMVNYPYNASFLEPLPAFPVEAVCSHFKTLNATVSVVLQELAAAVNVYYNYTGQAKCFDTSQTSTTAMGDRGWSFQACTEMVMPYCTDGKQDMFQPSAWDYAAYAQGCKATWNVVPRPDWTEIQYWGKNISAASNIVFSNGLLDPWSAGGVLKDVSASLVAVTIPEGAHHLDLRGANKDDPPSVTAARDTEKANIKKWIAEFPPKKQ